MFGKKSEPISTQLPYIKFTFLPESREFDLEIYLHDCKTEEDKIKQCTIIYNFIENHCSTSMYPMLRNSFEKLAEKDPIVAHDAKILAGLVTNLEVKSIQPCVKPSEVFVVKKD